MLRAGPLGFTLLAIAAAGRLGAADLQFWNTTSFLPVQTSRIDLEAFAVLRTRDHVSEAYDRRLGAQLRLRTHHKVTLGFGYLRRRVDPDGSGAHPENRAYAGPIFLLLPGPLRVEAVTLYERHFGIRGVNDFNRYKQRMELERMRKGASPYLNSEATFLTSGFSRLRNQAGLRWRFEGGRSFEVCYQFETLKLGGVLRPRHSIRTTLSLGRLWR